MTDKALPDNVADLARILVLVKATELDTCEEIAEALWPHLAPAPTLQESPGDERVVAIRFRVMQEHDDVTPLEYLRARYNHARDDRAYLLSLFPMHHKQNATDAASETNDASPSPTPAPTKAEVTRELECLREVRRRAVRFVNEYDADLAVNYADPASAYEELKAVLFPNPAGQS